MKAAALLAPLMLTGCASMLQLDISQFSTFEVKQGVQSPHPVVVQWHATDDLAEIQELCKEAPGLKVGCAIMRYNVCLIVTQTKTAHETLGHEARHCFEWHLPDREKFHR